MQAGSPVFGIYFVGYLDNFHIKLELALTKKHSSEVYYWLIFFKIRPALTTSKDDLRTLNINLETTRTKPGIWEVNKTVFKNSC